MCTKLSYQLYSFLLFYPSVLTRVILYIHTYIHVLLSAHYSYLMYRVGTWFLYSSLWFIHRYSLPTFFTAKERLAILLFNPPHTSNSFPIFSNYTSNFFLAMLLNTRNTIYRHTNQVRNPELGKGWNCWARATFSLSWRRESFQTATCTKPKDCQKLIMCSQGSDSVPKFPSLQLSIFCLVWREAPQPLPIFLML